MRIFTKLQGTLAVLVSATMTSSLGAPMAGGCPVLPGNHILNTRIDALPTHPDSAAFIKRIGANYSGSTYTGNSNKLVHLDLGTQTSMVPMDTYYGIPSNILSTAGAPGLWKRVHFLYNGVDATTGYADESDCAIQSSPGVFTPIYPCTPTVGTATWMPILPVGSGTGGAGELKIEGGVASSSAAGDPADPAAAYDEYGDHHILTIDTATCTLWEAYHAYPLNGSVASNEWEVLSIARFNLNSNQLRQADVTSADAAGLPIYPLLLRAEEANAGPDAIQHALRFTIVGSKVRGTYVWPARHKTGSSPADGTVGDDGLRPPMGQLFRLPANFDITTVPGWVAGQAPHPQTVAVVNALKRYGMYLADNGSNMYIQGEASNLWASQTFSQLQRIPHTAFEAVDLSPITTHPGFDPNSAAVPNITPDSPSDFNDDGRSDLLWRNGADGSVQGWLMNGLSATQVAGLLPAGGYTITHVADLDGNGKADTLIRHTDGTTIGWLHDGLNVVGQATFFAPGSGWSIKHTLDLNGDGKADLIVEHTDGRVVGWLMNGLTVTGTATFVPAGTGWSVSRTGDLNGDGKADLIWQNSNGTVQAWLMDGLSATQTATFVGSGTGWSVKLVGDFNGDGKTDLMWQNTDGTVQAWLMDGTAISQIASFVPAGTGWSPVLAGDIDGDGKADLFWEHTDGRSQTWLMNGLTVTNLAGFVGAGGWKATHLLDLNGDGKKDVLWKHTDGTVQGWLLNGLTITQIASLAAAGSYEVVPPRP